jgi:hypothetical protein
VLGDGVGGTAVAAEGGNRSDVDDGAATGGTHVRQHSAAQLHGRGQVHAQDTIPLIVRHLVERHESVEHAGRVREDVDAAVHLEHTAHERLDLVELAEVDADHVAAPADGGGRGACLVQAPLVDIATDNRGALLREA